MRRPLPDAFRRRATRPSIIGHRGVRGSKPENTLAAISEAKRQGADGVEIDVRLCATGEVVVFHDPDLERIGKDPRAVAAVSFEELRRVDAGGGERIPTLEEALELTRSLQLGLNVEIKHDAPDRPRAVGAVARVLRRWDAGHDVVVSSFDPGMLLAHRALVRRCHALLVHESTYHDWALRIARYGRADGVHMEVTLAVPARARWFVEHAFVNGWTINDATRARSMFEVGLDAIITDEPSALLAAFGA